MGRGFGPPTYQKAVVDGVRRRRQRGGAPACWGISPLGSLRSRSLSRRETFLISPECGGRSMIAQAALDDEKSQTPKGGVTTMPVSLELSDIRRLATSPTSCSSNKESQPGINRGTQQLKPGSTLRWCQERCDLVVEGLGGRGGDPVKLPTPSLKSIGRPIFSVIGDCRHRSILTRF